MTKTQSVRNRHIVPEPRWYKRWLMETSGAASRPVRPGFPKSRFGHTRRSTSAIVPLAPAAPPTSDELSAVSACMRQVYALIRQLAPTEVTLTLTGETGTGKDVLAHLIHSASPRRGAPFVVFDCGAVPANLVESELFGHERGAFTGARRRACRRLRARQRRHAVPRRDRRAAAASCSRSCCACSRTHTVRRVGGTPSAGSTSASSRPPTAICGRWSAAAVPPGPLLPARGRDRPPAAACAIVSRTCRCSVPQLLRDLGRDDGARPRGDARGAARPQLAGQRPRAEERPGLRAWPSSSPARSSRSTCGSCRPRRRTRASIASSSGATR